MEDYNKIIESLSVRYVKAKNITILNPVSVQSYYDVENTILLVNIGQVSYGPENNLVNEGEIVFIPGGKMLAITYGSGNPDELTKDDFLNVKERYFETTETITSGPEESFCFVSFDAKVFDSVNFFASLDIPPFIIKEDNILGLLIKEVVRETFANLPGRDWFI